MIKRVRKKGEVLLTRLGLAVVPRMPRGCVVRLSRFLGGVGYAFARETRRVGRANLDIAFGGDKSDAEKRQILRASFQTFALVLLDIFWFTRDTQARIAKFVHLDENARSALTPSPQMCVTAHLGNWEILGQAVNAAGFPMHSVAAPLDNPEVDALFVPARQLTGQNILRKEGVLRSMLKVLRAGDRVGILLDQNTKPSQGGVFCPLFGLPAPVARGAAMLALRVRAWVMMGFCIPRRDGSYEIYVADHFPPESISAGSSEVTDAAIDALTARILAVIEDAIRRDPGCWLWMYKRWKYIPPGADASDYPYYAHPLV